MTLRVGVVILPTDRWDVARHHWRWAEDAGFATAWTYDHLRWGGFPDGPWHGAYPTLAAAAQVTGTIRLGTLVTSPNFRHPLPLAREVVTLDDLSGGRFDLGIGAGSAGPDAELFGEASLSASERHRRFAEFVDALDHLLVHPRPTFEGDWFRAVDAPDTPGCVQRPRVPFTIAAAGPRAMAVVARHAQQWVTYGAVGAPAGREPLLDAVRRQCTLLEDSCAQIGRDQREVRRVLLLGAINHGIDSVEAFRELAGPYAELGFDELVVHHPHQTGPYGGDLRVFEALAAAFSGDGGLSADSA
jgi:alkanesulfonate monooxygenase SsuD/methylene tetrahydromethanopterin reductase-like flavin-dependent oxidoreductase (luciferase family)